MVLPALRRLLHAVPRPSWRNRRQAKRTRNATYRPRLEQLEEWMLLSQVTWANPVSGDWSVAENWNVEGGGHRVPAPDDDVSINTLHITVTHSSGTDSIRSISCAADALVISGGSLTIANRGDIANSLSVAGGAQLTAAGFLSCLGTVTVNGTLTATNSSFKDVTVGNGGVLETINPTGMGKAVNQGTVRFRGEAFAESFSNQGSVEMRGADNTFGSLTTGEGSALRLIATSSNVKLYVASGFTNNGTIDLNNEDSSPHDVTLFVFDNTGGNSTVVNNTSINVLTGTGGGKRNLFIGLDNRGTVNLSDTPSILSGGAVNSGTINVGGNLVMGGLTSTSGTVTVANGRTLDISGATFTYNGGTVSGGTLLLGRTINLNAAFSFGTGSLVLNNAMVTGPGSLINAGGQLQVTNTTFAGNLAVANHDQMVVLGNANALNGTFTNSGRLLLTQTALTVANGFTNEGDILLGNARLTINSGTLTNSATILGNGSVTAPRLDNQGTITAFGEALGVSGTTESINSGTLNANDGDLYFGGLTTTMNGTLNIAAGRTLSTGGNPFNFNGGSVNGPGRLFLSGLVGLSVDLSYGGTLLFSGTMLGSGDLFNKAGSTLILQGSTIDTRLINRGLLICPGGNTIGGKLSTTATSVIKFPTYDFPGSTTTITQEFDNEGTIELGDITTRGWAWLTVTNGQLRNFGTINVLDGRVPDALVLDLELVQSQRGIFTTLNHQVVLRKSQAHHVNGGTINLTGGDLLIPPLFSGSPTFSNGGGAINIGSGRTFDLTGVTFSNFNGGTVTGSGTLILRISTVNLVGDLELPNSQFDSVTVNSPGTLTVPRGKTLTSNSNATINAPLVNAGTLNVMPGTLILTGGGMSSGPIILAGANSEVDLMPTGTFTLSTGSNITGPGRLFLLTGTVSISGTVSAAGNWYLISGILDGPGTLTITNNFEWSYNGRMAGTGTTDIAAGARLNITHEFPRRIEGRTLNNFGTATWTGAGDIEFGQGAVFNNQAGAIFDAQNDQQFINLLTGAAPQFNNAGTFRKSAGTASTRLNIPFNNSGTVQVQATTLSLGGGPDTSSGSFTVAALATLVFADGDHTLTDTSSVTGAGDVVFSGGLTRIRGTLSVTGTTFITGGTVELASDATIQKGVLSGGNMKGAGNVTFTAGLTWTGGSMNGDDLDPTRGTTTMAGTSTLTISGPDMKRLNRAFNNQGMATWTGTGNIECAAAARFENGGQFDAQNDQGFSLSEVGLSFTNSGTFRKSAGSGSTVMGVPFTNSGTVQVQSGKLELNSSSDESGSFAVEAGATLRFFGAASGDFSSTSSITGAGNVLFDWKPLGGAVIYMAGTYDVSGETQIGGMVDFGGTARTGSVINRGRLGLDLSGSLSVSTNYVQEPEGTLVINIGMDRFGQLNVGNQATLDGKLQITLFGGFVPDVGSQFRIVSYGSHTGFFAQELGTDLVDRRLDLQYDAGGLTLVTVPNPSAPPGRPGWNSKTNKPIDVGSLLDSSAVASNTDGDLLTTALSSGHTSLAGNRADGFFRLLGGEIGLVQAKVHFFWLRRRELGSMWRSTLSSSIALPPFDSQNVTPA